jgi:hypothetical protein
VTLQRCVDVKDAQGKAPALLGPAIVTPPVAAAGTRVSVDFSVDASLAFDPAVTLALEDAPVPLAPDLAAVDRAAGTYRYLYTATGREPEGAIAVNIALVGSLGDEAAEHASVTFDFTPPAVRTLAFELPADQTALNGSEAVTAAGTVDADATLLGAWLVDRLGTRLAPVTASLTSDPALPALLRAAAAIDLHTVDLGASDALAIELSLEDPAGNVSAPGLSRGAYVPVDRTPPDVPTLTVLDGTLVTTQGVLVGFSVNGATEMYVDGDLVDDGHTRKWIALSPTLQMTLTATPGAKTITVRYRDGAHNESAIATAMTTLSALATVAPTILVPAAGARTLGLATVHLAWTAPDSASAFSVMLLDAGGTPIWAQPQAVSGTTLDISVPDAVGYRWRVWASASPAAFAESSFEAMDDTVYVSCPSGMACSDVARVGNKSTPLRTVAGATNVAAALGLARIAVASRGASAAYDGAVTLPSGVSLIGGYDAAFSARNVVANETILASAAFATLSIAGATSAMSVDGFTINGANGTPGTSVALYVLDTGPNLTVTDCKLFGGAAATASYGLYAAAGGARQTPSIVRGQIDAGAVSAGPSIGMYLYGTNASVQGTTHILGGATNNNPSYGLYSDTSSPTFANVVLVGAGAVTGTVFDGGLVEFPIAYGAYVTGGTGDVLSATSVVFDSGAQGSARTFGADVNQAAVAASGCTFHGRAALGGSVTIDYPGATGVRSSGALTLQSCTVIADQSDAQSTGIEAGGPLAVSGGTVTSGTSAQGFSVGINANGGVYATSITITDANVASGASGQQSIGVWLAGQQATVRRNRITAGSALYNSDALRSKLVSASSAVSILADNVARGGPPSAASGESSAFNIDLGGANGADLIVITNNTLLGGVTAATGQTTHALYLDAGGLAGPSRLLVTNNLFATQAGTGKRRCVFETAALDDPAALVSNVFVECPSAGYEDFVSAGGGCPSDATHNCWTLQTDLNNVSRTVQSGTATGNLAFATAASVGFISWPNDLHLAAATGPTGVRFSGVNAASAICGNGSETCGAVVDDLDRAARTCPTPATACFSIGAYEQDN